MRKGVEERTARYVAPEPGEEVVISGIAGRFPESDNMRMLEKNLFNKVDLITDDERRWSKDHKDVPHRTGKVNNISKFDAVFFGIHSKQAEVMDPMGRMLLEHTYEAIIDAGVNPKHVRGTNTAVIVGCSTSEAEKEAMYEEPEARGLALTGCCRAMLSNRIAYWLDVHGPSFTIDTACSSGMVATELAYSFIRSGKCDQAIVAASNLCLHPALSLQFFRLGVLSSDGRCKAFDADANGYARSEAISVIFLQKAKAAKRVYATIVHGLTNSDGFKEQGITFPSKKVQSDLFKKCYEECGISPTVLSYLEAHGTGTKVGDPEEINAIDSVFCKGRMTPLKIGSVKSNLGHSEASSGLCSIAKVIIAMETGIIPPNLYYTRPRDSMKALQEGRLEIVTERTAWKGGYAGVNAFGFGGVNCHILLKHNPKEKINNGEPQDNLPRLVVVSGRTTEAVTTILDDVENQPVDIEYIRLLHDIHAEEVQNHLYRGYTMLGLRGSENIRGPVAMYSGSRRPVWFVFSGMGSQWPGMGKALMKFPVFATAIEKCNTALQPYGIDLYNILNTKDKKIFDNILNSFLGIAAVQIGLVDLLTHVGIVPDNVIGHSVGELGCAYADGCFTAEQTIVAAYFRGIASKESTLIEGLMAAVGRGYRQVKNMCPPDIDIACHNSADSCTISGPAQSVKTFVAQLQENKIFARAVPTSNIAYHSRYIAEVGPKLLAYLKQVIPNPKERSAKWISTSVPQSEWSAQLAKLSSAEYHTNNLLSAVLFEETAALIPADAIAIEIAPHGLLQAILKKSMPPTMTNLSLTLRGHKDNAKMFLQALGTLYNAGLQLQLAKLYPEVEYPVSRGTPMISPLIKWDYSADWNDHVYAKRFKLNSGEREIDISLALEHFAYLAGHVIDGRNLMPGAGYLVLIWETFSIMNSRLYTEMPVVFENIKFQHSVILRKGYGVMLHITIQQGTGLFEIMEDGVSVVTGRIRRMDDASHEKITDKILQEYNNVDEDVKQDEWMTTDDIYKELKLRGYQYSGLFRGLINASVTSSKGHTAWEDNWVAFMDHLLQLRILLCDTRDLFVPTSINKLVIDPKYQENCISNASSDRKQVPVCFYKDIDTVISGGVEIREIKTTMINKRRPAGYPVLETHQFIAHRDNAEVTLQEAMTMVTHLALENQPPIVQVQVVELVDDCNKIPAEDLGCLPVINAISDLPLMQPKVTLVTKANGYSNMTFPDSVTVTPMDKFQPEDEYLLVILYGLLQNSKTEHLQKLLSSIKNGAFVLTRESSSHAIDLRFLREHGLSIILQKRRGNEWFVLLKKQTKFLEKVNVVSVNNGEFPWLQKIQSILKDKIEQQASQKSRLIIVAEKEFDSGILGLVNCVRKEPGGNIVRAIFIQDMNAPKFSIQHPLYAEQMQLDLAINVLRPGGVWGSYRHLPLLPLQPKLVEHAYMDQTIRGDLTSMHWLEGPLSYNLANSNLICVMYSSINFKDVMISTGRLPIDISTTDRRDYENMLGFEYSGYDNTGCPVMGVTTKRGFSNLVHTDKSLTWPVPEGWTLEDAATVPCVYATCYYALYLKGRMKKGDRVLIHAGSGGIGQAAIHLAFHEGCEIFTTVGTPEKRKFIRKTFPFIPDKHIGNSRDTSFEQLILKETKGKGVDIVLNSLAEDKLQASLRCLAPKGRFLEIGKFDLASNNSLGMNIFLKEVSFQGIMLDNLLASDTDEKIQLGNLLTYGLRSGAVKPLPRKVFKIEKTEAAFRYIAAAKHIGKVLIQIHEDKSQLNTPILALPRFYCHPNKCYVIVGGLGGFGLELTDWLVLRGAKHLVLVSRNGLQNGYQRARIELWKSYGTKVSIITGLNISIQSDCEYLLKSAEEMAPVDGIFNVAVVLKDSACINQTPESFEQSFKPKAWATQNLDAASRKMCPKLRHFVVFSSISCGRGNAGQTNYGMSNSVMERVCEKRVQEGYPGLAIQWGAVGQVGLLADMSKDDKTIVIGGTLQQEISSCLEVLDNLLLQNAPVVGSMVVAEKNADCVDFNSMPNTVANIMGLKDLKSVSSSTTLAELGMDSIMALEIKQVLERHFDIFFSTQDVRNLNFAKLLDMATERKKKMPSHEDISAEPIIANMKLRLLLLATVNTVINSDVCVTLPTRNEETESPVFIIPGMDGLAHVFFQMAPKLKSRAICMQAGIGVFSQNHNTIQDMVDFLLPYVLENIKGQKHFRLVGHSFGTIIALELAQKLEMQGLTGRIILIDGTPESLIVTLKESFPLGTDQEIQYIILTEVFKLFNPTSADAEVFVELDNCATWEQKLDMLMRHIPAEVLVNPVEIYKPYFDTIFKRIRALLSYNPSRLNIKSSVILLKAEEQVINFADSDDGLKKLTRGKFETYVVPGNHVTMLSHEKVAVIVNEKYRDDNDAH